MTEPFYSNGLQFSCKRCSFCCGHSPGFVYLSRRDLTALLDFFKTDAKSFVQKYCRWADYYYGEQVLALKEMENYDCILWHDGCTAYAARPLQCSTYPFWTWMLKDKATWDDCAADCPGMNQGALHPRTEIEEKSTLYSQNAPLRRHEVEELFDTSLDQNATKH